MNTFEYPDFIARFYDVIYHRVRDAIDTRFYGNKILSVNGKVLEVGVGTGRLFKDALNKGADIYGIDISKSMVDVLKSNIPVAHHHRVKIGDAVTMKWDWKFDLIIAPFRVFSHIQSVEDQLAFLNNINVHLTDNGQFIFDVFVPSPFLLANGIKEQTDFEGEYEPGKQVKRIVSSVPDHVNQVLDVTMKLIWDDKNQVLEKEWKFKMRIFFRYELEHLVHLSDLELDTIYGNYLQQPLDNKSSEFIVVCRKSDVKPS
jgi:SAM-dependent methyltransferase